MTPAAHFFTTLYAGQTSILELRTFGPEESDQSPQAQRQRRTASRLRDFVPIENGVLDMVRVGRFLEGCERAHLGAFFGVATRTRSAPRDWKGDAAHCHTLTALFVDGDFKHLGEAQTRAHLADYSTAPSILVNSGGGLHPYWLLSQPLDLQAEYEDARQLLRSLAYTVAAIVDVSVSEPARVLRIPGSLNFKYTPPRPVVLEQISDVRIDRRLLSLASQPAGLRSSFGASRGTSSGVALVLPDVIVTRERHETLRRLLRSLQAHGLALEDAITVCTDVNRTRCQAPLSDTELESYLGRVGTYADRPTFTRSPKSGWDLAAALLELGLSVEATLAAVRSVTPDFDPETNDAIFDPGASA